MRQHKYRAWNKINKEWWFCEIPNGSFLNELALDGNKKRQFKNTDLEPWQQYTGLKDRNGKEIYEGDIIKVNRFWKDQTDREITFICWDESEACFVLGHIEYFDYSIARINKEFEVIGNLYENPNLLNLKERE